MRDRALRIGLFVSCALLIATQVWIYLAYRLEADDDLIWLYQSARMLQFGPSDVAGHYAAYHAFLEQVGAGIEWLTRAEMRQALGASQNYLFTSGWIAVAAWIGQATVGISDYPSYMTAVALWAYSTEALAVALGVAAIFVTRRDPRIGVAFALTLLLLLGLDLIGNWLGDNYTLELIAKQTIEAGKFSDSLWHTLIDPTPAFSPYYPPAKNRAQMLLMLVMLLRWSDRPASSYGLLLFGAFWHQDYIGLFTLAFVTADLVRQPHIFRRPVVVLLAGLGIALYLLRGSLLWDAVGSLPPSAILAGVAALVAVCFGLFLIRRPIARLQLVIFGDPAKRSMTTSILQDLGVQGILWFVSLLLLVPVSLNASDISSSLLWGSVHGRLYGMIHPSVALGLCLVVTAAASKRFGVARLQVAAGSAVLLSGLALMVWSVGNVDDLDAVQARVESQFRTLDQPTVEPLRPGEAAEALFFYLSAKSLDTGTDLVGDAFEAIDQEPLQ